MSISVRDITQWLEQIAPLALQESYDNSGLIIGDEKQTITNILVTLDCTEDVVDEAMAKGCNLIVAHHPIIFSGLKKINGKNYVERTVIKAIKHDIAVYAIHTNLDNMHDGVNKKLATQLGLQHIKLLLPKDSTLKKLVTFVPQDHLADVRKALFDAGAGTIGKYYECSFSSLGTGTFRAQEHTHPFVGEIGKLHEEVEMRVEVVFPAHLQHKLIQALIETHPYEEVAYDVFSIESTNKLFGSGMIGSLENEMDVETFLAYVKNRLNLQHIRYTPVRKNIKTVAVCGGVGSFLIKNALRSGADAYITADVKYHEFFDGENQLLLADIGHYESEFFTKALIKERILEKFPTFAVLLSEINTNPINYY